MLGTRDDAIDKRDHSYVVYHIDRCTDEFRDKTQIDPLCKEPYEGAETCARVDPKCESEANIDEWTNTKKTMFKLVNKKIYFKSFNHQVRHNEVWTPTLPIGPGQFTDAGYRFRLNSFEGDDSWNPLALPTLYNFFDYKFYNVDTYSTGKKQGHNVCELYWRVDTDKIEHSR